MVRGERVRRPEAGGADPIYLKGAQLFRAFVAELLYELAGVHLRGALTGSMLRAAAALSARILAMGYSVTFLLVRRLLDLLRLGPSPDPKDVEIAVLRLSSPC